MNDRDLQFRVGVVVLAAVILCAILVVLFGDAASPFRKHKTIFVKFPEAPGIMVDSPVRKSGILIGRVKGVDFTPDGQILVTISINPDVKLYRTDRARISTSLLGDATLEFVPARVPAENPPPANDPLTRAEQGEGQMRLVSQLQPTQPPAPPQIEEGEVIEGEVSPSPTQVLVNLEDKIGRAAESLGRAGTQVDVLAGRLNSILSENDQQIGNILRKSETALDSFNRTMTTFDDLLGDPQLKEDLRRSLADLPKLLAETRQAMAGIQKAATLADENLTNLRGFTGPLGERGDELITKIESGVTNLDELLAQLATFSRSINDSEGSLGQLVHNPDLYQNLNQAALNIQQASQQLQPIVNDVRVFTDKISRDPGRLGVSGALQKNAPIKGLPPQPTRSLFSTP